jgi:hypothetical protein
LYTVLLLLLTADMLPRAFKWRNIYIWPIIVFPLIFCIGDTFLVLWFDAIHPTHEMRCDVRDPLW